MKNKSVLTLILCLFLVFTSEAQTKLRLITGVNSSHASVSDFIMNKPTALLGYFGGLQAEHKINRFIGLSTDLQVSRKGSNFQIDATNVSTHKYLYLDILPELNLYLLNNLSIGAGGNIATRLKDEYIYRGQSQESGAKDFDYGVTTSVKYNFKKVLFFARYNLGLGKTIDISGIIDNNTSFEYWQKNRNIQVGLGYQLF